MIVLMKLLNGAELGEFIKERQARAVRGLRQAHHIAPHLAIIRTNPSPVVDRYMKLKKGYGADIGVDVTVHTIDQSEALTLIGQLNDDETVQGIIVQLPLPDPTQTEVIVNAVAAIKDVDGLAAQTDFDPATPLAIDWLLAGYNIELKNRHLLIVGLGRLVGQPLLRLWKASNYTVDTADINTDDLTQKTLQADVIVSATGQPGLITASMVKPNAIIVDAGVATSSNGLVGDIAPDVRELKDITITPQKGGVGPLTVCAIFENVIHAARKSISV